MIYMNIMGNYCDSNFCELHSLKILENCINFASYKILREKLDDCRKKRCAVVKIYT